MSNDDGGGSAPLGNDHRLIKFDGVAGNRDKEADDGLRYTVIEYARCVEGFGALGLC